MAGVDKEATLVSLECHTSPPAACTDFPPQVIISVVLTDPFCLTCLTCLSCLACLAYPDSLSLRCPEFCLDEERAAGVPQTMTKPGLASCTMGCAYANHPVRRSSVNLMRIGRGCYSL